MKSNFKRNLLIGFGVSLLILLVSGIASLVSIRSLLRSAEWVNHTNNVIIQLGEIYAAMLDAETGQRGYLLSRSEEFLDPYMDAQARAQRAFEQVKVATFDNPAQQENLNQLKDQMDLRFSLLKGGIDSVRTGSELGILHLEKGRSSMQKIRNILMQMEVLERQLLLERTSTMNRFAAMTPPVIVAAALIAIIITLLFYVRVNNDYGERVKLQEELLRKDRETAERISIIQHISDKIAQGHYDIRADEQQRDSLGLVSVSLNKMATALEKSFALLSEKEWLKTGLNRLNDVLIGEKDVDQLCKDAIPQLCNYAGAPAGAIYLLENDELKAVGGFSYVPDKIRTTVKGNHGLLGQCIASNEVLELKDVPSQNIHIALAGGEVRPRHVVAIPLLDGREIKGAMELASLDFFSSNHIDYLKAASSNLAIAIHTAQNRKRLQELLEETQTQSEELLSQHSELENVNSELEMQTQKLQASEEELRVQQEELRQANVELEERSRLLEERNQLISERNMEIQAKADELAQSTKYKSEFLANMSHELRTPLNSILLLSRLMVENPGKNLSDDQIEYAKVIQSSGQGLLLLIDEILDLSKIEAGKMDLQYQEVSVQEIITDMQMLFAPAAHEKKIEFKTSVESNMVTSFEVDKLRLEQILRNLLSNALKFTSHGFVSLHVQMAKSDKIRFSVRDTGIGIPAEKQKLIFEAFQQADGSTRRKYGGTGLGLSISRELARLLHGEIELVSEVDAGSTFSLILPVKRPLIGPISENGSRSTPEQAFTSPPRVEKKLISSVIPDAVSDDRQEVSTEDKTILIIDDDVNFAKSLLEFTHKRGYKGIVAVRGDEGLELAKEYRPSGILLDLELPIMNGWEVMEKLKSDPATQHIPVHIMSSHQVPDGEPMAKGAIDFISKPVAFDQIKEVFGKLELVLNNSPKKVLIVEESERHALALAYFLEKYGITVEVRNEVRAAIESLENDRVDCVILDMGIPDQNTYDTLDAVKQTPGMENLPIIIFSGKTFSPAEELRLKKFAGSIVVKTAHSYKRILDEVSLFLHLVEEKQKREDAHVGAKRLAGLDDVLNNKKVLIVDDDMRNIFSLTKVLEKFKMKVVAAVDGKESVEKLRHDKEIDVVLMDMMMPQMDGYEALGIIRKDLRNNRLPIIAVTAKAMAADRVKCINAGASDYITKPVDIDQLLSLLRVWLYESGRK